MTKSASISIDIDLRSSHAEHPWHVNRRLRSSLDGVMPGDTVTLIVDPLTPEPSMLLTVIPSWLPVRVVAPDALTAHRWRRILSGVSSDY